MNQRFFPGGVHFAPWCKSLVAISAILGNRKRSFRRPLSKSKYMTAKLTTWVCADGWASEMVKCGTSFVEAKGILKLQSIFMKYTDHTQAHQKIETNNRHGTSCNRLIAIPSRTVFEYQPICLLLCLHIGYHALAELLSKVFFYGPPQRMLQATDNVTPCGRNTDMNA